MENQSTRIFRFYFCFISFAGTPPTRLLDGTSVTTAALGAITTLSPIVIGPIIETPLEMVTLSPITGASSSGFRCPINTIGRKVQFSPILALSFTIIVPQCHIVNPLPQVFGGI